MSVKNVTVEVKIIPGAIYRKEMPDGSVEYATMVAVVEKAKSTSGLLQRWGHSPTRVVQGIKSFNDWEVYSEPGLVRSKQATIKPRSRKREQPVA